MSELLANIKRWAPICFICPNLIFLSLRSIKLYGWEFAFLRKILQVRNEQELVMLRKLGIVTVRFVVAKSYKLLVLSYRSRLIQCSGVVSPFWLRSARLR